MSFQFLPFDSIDGAEQHAQYFNGVPKEVFKIKSQKKQEHYNGSDFFKGGEPYGRFHD